jgi:hypothetical protein
MHRLMAWCQILQIIKYDKETKVMCSKIVIIGTDHKLQCGKSEKTKKFSDDKHDKFKSIIEELCKNYKINLLAEEMSDQGLANHGVEETVSSEVARNINIKHEYIDLTIEQRRELYIADENFVPVSISLPSSASIENTRPLLVKNLSSPIRERYWLAKILSLDTWPTLFVCGADHADNMVALINSIIQGPIISWHKCCPGEDGRLL